VPLQRSAPSYLVTMQKNITAPHVPSCLGRVAHRVQPFQPAQQRAAKRLRHCSSHARRTAEWPADVRTGAFEHRCHERCLLVLHTPA